MDSSRLAIALIILLFSTICQVHGQRFKNASSFKTDSAQDKLVDESLLDFPSHELILYKGNAAVSPQGNRLDEFRIADYLPVPNDPDTSLRLRNGYFQQEIDPLGSNPDSLPATPESIAILGDFDGDGKKDIVRAMEDDRGEILVYLLTNIEVGNSQVDINQSQASTLIHRIPAPSNYLEVSAGHPTLKLEKAKLGEGEKDYLLITYLRRQNDSLYQLNLDVWQDQLLDQRTWNFTFARANNLGDLAPHFDVTTGDFDLDGIPEIALTYQELENIQYANTSSTPRSFFAFVKLQLIILEFKGNELNLLYEKEVQQSNISAIDINQNFGSSVSFSYTNIITVPILLVEELTGDWVPELVILTPILYDFRAFSPSNGGAGIMEVTLKGDVFQLWDDSTLQGTNFYDTLINISSINNNLRSNAFPPGNFSTNQQNNIQMSTEADFADVDGDGEVELIFGTLTYKATASETRVGSNEIGIMELTPAANNRLEFSVGAERQQINPGFQIYPVIRKFLEIGDLDGDGISEISSFYPLNSFDFEVHSYTPSQGSSQGTINLIGRKLLSNLTGAGTIQLLGSDLDGDGIRVGRPKYFQRTGIQQPLVILNAPPIHFDSLGGQIFEINGCYINEPNEDCEFLARYTNNTSRSFTATTEFQSDWSVGASVSGSVSGLIAKVEGKMTSTYGQSFSSLSRNGQSISIGTTVEASIEDRIYASVMQYGVYEYPIFSNDSIIGHLVTITPELQQNRWFSTDSWSAFDYFPRHEVGNIMSYEGFFDVNGSTDLNKDLTVAAPVQLLGDGLSVDNSSTYSQTITIGDFSNDVKSFGTNFGISTEASTTVGKKLFGLGAELTVSVSGDYSQSNLSTFESSVSNTLTLDVSMGSNQSGLESNYLVSPYLYWAKNGALVLDYTVQPEVEILGGTPTFWSAKYGQAQDPALLLPFRLHPEKGLILQEEIKRFQSRGITYSPRNAQPGDTISLFAAVHNYSLVPTQGRVKAAFYLGNPNCPGAQRLLDTNGNNVAFTDGTDIPARGRKLISFEWVIPQNITTNPRIFVQLDPDDEMNEVHEENNLGWTILEILGSGLTQYCNDISVPTSVGEGEIRNELSIKAYPNPSSGMVNFDYVLEKPSKVSLEILDLSGRQLAKLVDKQMGMGNYSYSFDGTELANGIYFFRFVAEEKVRTGRLVLNR